MPTILTSYHITRETLALIPAKQITYETIAIEQHISKHINMPSLQIIKTSCYKNWTTYEGIREVVHHHTKFKQKVPIPINIQQGLYFFPTHSPHNIHNSWIAHHHIEYISKSTENKKPIIHFKNGKTLLLDISMHTLRKQIDRTFECRWRAEGMEAIYV